MTRFSPPLVSIKLIRPFFLDAEEKREEGEKSLILIQPYEVAFHNG